MGKKNKKEKKKKNENKTSVYSLITEKSPILENCNKALLSLWIIEPPVCIEPEIKRVLMQLKRSDLLLLYISSLSAP